MPEPSEKDRAVANAWATKVDCNVAPAYLVSSMRIDKEKAIKQAEARGSQGAFKKCLRIVQSHDYDTATGSIIYEEIQKAADKAREGKG